MKQTRIDLFFQSSKPKTEIEITVPSPKKKHRTKSRKAEGKSLRLDDFCESQPTPNIGEFQAHFELEVMEHRLRTENPQNSLSGLPAAPLGNLTESERRLSERYTTINESSMIPSFWERRVYDRPCDIMSQADSESLQSIICDSPKYDRSSWQWPTPENCRDFIIRIPNRRNVTETPPRVTKTRKSRRNFVLEP